MGGAGGRYPRWNNSGAKSQILHVLTYKWELNSEYTWMYRMESLTLETPKGGRVGGGWRLKNYLLGTTFTIQMMGSLRAPTSLLHNTSMLRNLHLYPLNICILNFCLKKTYSPGLCHVTLCLLTIAGWTRNWSPTIYSGNEFSKFKRLYSTNASIDFLSSQSYR